MILHWFAKPRPRLWNLLNALILGWLLEAFLIWGSFNWRNTKTMNNQVGGQTLSVMLGVIVAGASIGILWQREERFLNAEKDRAKRITRLESEVFGNGR